MRAARVLYQLLATYARMICQGIGREFFGCIICIWYAVLCQRTTVSCTQRSASTPVPRAMMRALAAVALAGHVCAHAPPGGGPRAGDGCGPGAGRLFIKFDESHIRSYMDKHINYSINLTASATSTSSSLVASVSAVGGRSRRSHGTLPVQGRATGGAPSRTRARSVHCVTGARSASTHSPATSGLAAVDPPGQPLAAEDPPIAATDPRSGQPSSDRRAAEHSIAALRQRLFSMASSFAPGETSHDAFLG